MSRGPWDLQVRVPLDVGLPMAGDHNDLLCVPNAPPFLRSGGMQWKWQKDMQALERGMKGKDDDEEDDEEVKKR